MKRRTESYMGRAVELSRLGYPAPNPHVGCVIVQGDEIIAEGWHDFAGGPHAEAMALAIAGERARGSDLFCTLEPCNHVGRTGPCTHAIVQAGISRVFVAVRDPNPTASGGIETLVESGVQCEVGTLENEARVANEVFLMALERKRPYVVVKTATSADGFIARSDGTSRWITGEESRAAGHRLRAEMGCVLVGRVTVERDDPLLTARMQGIVNQPLRVVLDPRAILAGSYKMFTDGGAVIRFVKRGFTKEQYDVEVESGPEGFDLTQVLSVLFERGVVGVLVEGGGETCAAFLRKGLVDRVERFTSPVTFGTGHPWLGSSAPELKLKKVGEERLGEDLHETFLVMGGTTRR